MRYDAIIIGGGHSGLEKGMEVLSNGGKCLIINSGPSSRRFREEGYDHASRIKAFKEAGGEFLSGEKVIRGDFKGNALKGVYTDSEEDRRYDARVFYLATGSFFTGGLYCFHNTVVEPVFRLDVDFNGGHSEWVNPDFFSPQPFMYFGVRITGQGCALRDHQEITNLYPIGSIVSRWDDFPADK